MRTVPRNSDNKMNVHWSAQVIRTRTILSITLATVVIFLSSSTTMNQSVFAQSGLRIIVHIYGEPFDLTYVQIYDEDGDYYNSKTITTRSDGTRNVEFRAPQGAFSVYEYIYADAYSDSGSCGYATGYNSPESRPEHLYMYMYPCF
jgi:hypothetical protein